MAISTDPPSPTRSLISPARIWRQLQSMTFAIIMLSLILLVIIAGSFMPKDSGVKYVYESPWFYALNFVLIASVVSCVSRRVGSVIRFAFKVPVVHRAEFYRAGDTSRALDAALSEDRATQAVVRGLKRQHYRVAVESRADGTHILADRFRAFRLGSLVSHSSIVLLVLTIVWGAFAGWLDQSVLLEAGGGPKPVGHGTGLILRSDSFNFGLYANGTPRNFHDHLTITDASGRQYHQVIDVNTPWYYGGIFGYDIHQASFGMTARLVALDAKGAVQPYCALQAGVNAGCNADLAPILFVPNNDGTYTPAGGGLTAFYMQKQNLVVSIDQIHDPVPMAKLPQTVVLSVLQPPGPRGGPMQLLKEQADMPAAYHSFGGASEMITTQPLTVKGLRLAILIRRIASVNIGHNPAVPFIFLSCILIIIGLVSVLYFPFTRLWVYVAPDRENESIAVQMRGSAEKSRQSFRRRFDVIVKSVQGELLRERGRM